jgi:hypothetical protein
VIPIAEQATVYRGGGRRWFSKKSACRAEAKAKIKSRCDCEQIDHGSMGVESVACSYHADMDRFQKIVRRLSNIYLHAMKGQQ